VDRKYLFEIGCASKNRKQIQAINNAFIVEDNIAFAVGNDIPLWL